MLYLTMLLTMLELIAGQSFDENIIEMVMTQLSLNRALKVWGKGAQNAVDAEMKQLHWRESFKPLHWCELTSQQKAMVLESHIFVTQKRCSLVST